MIRYLVVILVTAFLATSCTTNSATAKPNFVFKSAPTQGAMAKIGDKVYTEQDLIGDQRLNYVELKKKEFDFFKNQLLEKMKQDLIGEEAKKAGLSVDDYLAKNVFKGKLDVTDKEVDDFVAAKKIPKTQVNPQIKERIKNYLADQKKDDKTQELLARLTKSAPVEIYFSKPKMQIETTGGAAWGAEDAPVTIVEFSDFQCPFCSRAAATVSEIKDKYKGKVRIVFKHFPLSFHKDALPAAEASMCVKEQGDEKFWKFHDVTFKNQRSLKPEDLEKYAKEAGANVDKYKACLTANKYKDAVQEDVKYGEKIGVRSTPTFFINGELVAGALPVDKFSEAVDEALEEAKNSKH